MTEELKEVDVEFATSTSLHGVQHLVKRSRFYKIAWGILILVAAGFLLWNIIDRVQAYYKYPTSKESSEVHLKDMQFPTFTLCSTYRYNNDTMTEKERTVLEYNSPHFEILKNFGISSGEELLYILKKYWRPYKDKMKSLYPDGFNFMDIILQIAYGISNETLLTCKFNYGYCNITDFFPHLNLNYDLCWSFNSHLTVDTPLKVKNAGSGSGLVVIIDFQRDKYETLFQELLSKFFIYLNHHGEVPLGFTPSIIPVGPGKMAHIKVNYLKNSYLASPYGNCELDKEMAPYGMNTLANCLVDCKIDHFSEHCGCIPYIFEGFYESDYNSYCDIKDLFLCELSIGIPTTNVSEAELDYFTELPTLDCSFCKTPCTEHRYEARVFYTDPFDSEGVKYLMKSQNVSEDYVRKNYLILDIYFDTFVYHITEEKPLMTVSSLLSDIGGLFGLFMGMSVLTLLEIIDYMIRRCQLTVKSKAEYIQGKHKENIEIS